MTERHLPLPPSLELVERRRVEPAAAGSSAPARRAIAVLLSRFPLVTETFILREIEELERQGQAVRLVPLMRERHAILPCTRASSWSSAVASSRPRPGRRRRRGGPSRCCCHGFRS